MDRREALKLSSAMTVMEAAKVMADHCSGAVMVVDDGRLVGIFTERDALFRVVAQGMNVETTALRDVMTADPKTVDRAATYGYALLIMQENNFRHIPVVEDGRPIGLVESRNALDPDLEEFSTEVNRREYIRRGH